MRQATSEIPIVFAGVADPVGQGFVSSLARPGGNITGFASREFGLATKTLELLKKVAPAVDHVTFLYDPQQPAAVGIWAEIEAAAPLLGCSHRSYRFARLVKSKLRSLRLRARPMVVSMY
jgi:putative ABC transport system substrate-binding protein